MQKSNVQRLECGYNLLQMMQFKMLGITEHHHLTINRLEMQLFLEPRLIGLSASNGSRVAATFLRTSRNDKKSLSLGRVQTATLGNDSRSWTLCSLTTPAPFWELEAEFESGDAKWSARWERSGHKDGNGLNLRLIESLRLAKRRCWKLRFERQKEIFQFLKPIEIQPKSRRLTLI